MDMQRFFTSIVPKGKQNHGTCTVYIGYILNQKSLLPNKRLLFTGKVILNLYPQSMQIKSFNRGGKLEGPLFQAAEV